MKYYLAVCNEDGICVGFLKQDDTVCTDADLLDKHPEILLSYKRKADANEKVLQINLSHLLLPNGIPYRVVAVKA